MKYLFVIFFLGLVTPMFSQEQVRHAAGGKTIDVTLEMTVVEAVTVGKKGLRIRAKAERKSGDLEFVLNVSDGKTEFRKRTDQNEASTYRFPATLTAVDSSERFDRFLSGYFGNGTPVSLFKARGYGGISLKTPNELLEKGGEMYLADPAIDGSFFWTISIKLDPPPHRNLTLTIGEQRG